MIVTNLLSSFLGPLLLRSHLLSTWVWMTAVLLSTTIAHSGYHVPFLSSPEAHDFHHKYNTASPPQSYYCYTYAKLL